MRTEKLVIATLLCPLFSWYKWSGEQSPTQFTSMVFLSTLPHQVSLLLACHAPCWVPADIGTLPLTTAGAFQWSPAVNSDVPLVWLKPADLWMLCQPFFPRSPKVYRWGFPCGSWLPGSLPWVRSVEFQVLGKWTSENLNITLLAFFLDKCFCPVSKPWSCGFSLLSLWKVSSIIAKAVFTAKAVGKSRWFFWCTGGCYEQGHGPKITLRHHLGRCLSLSSASATSWFSPTGPFSGSVDSDNLGEGKRKKMNCLIRSPLILTVLIL